MQPRQTEEMVKQSLTPTAVDTNDWIALKERKKTRWLFQLLIMLFI